MIKVGITGGIGSGKSVVAKLFELYGYPVYTTDTESKRLTHESPIIREGLIGRYGDKIYQEGRLNKAMLASIIFNNTAERAAVNTLIHPVVKADFLNWAERQSSPLVCMECAILFESGFNQIVDHTLMVYAPQTVRIKRVAQRDGFSPEEIAQRIHSQMADEEKRKYADLLIINDDQQALIPQVTACIGKLLHCPTE